MSINFFIRSTTWKLRKPRLFEYSITPVSEFAVPGVPIPTINIFQPDILCIGGGVCNEGDPLLLPLKELVAKEIYTKNSAKNTEIVIAKLGNDAGIIGAAFLGLSHKK